MILFQDDEVKMMEPHGGLIALMSAPSVFTSDVLFFLGDQSQDEDLPVFSQ